MKTYLNPQFQGLNMDGVYHISPSDAFDAITSGKATLMDLRESYETASECFSIDQVLYHPVSVFLERLDHISKDQPFILSCAHGIRSVQVVKYLMAKGYTQLVNLDGGFAQWKAQGLPTKGGMTFMSNCGCEVENSSDPSCCVDTSGSATDCCSI